MSKKAIVCSSMLLCVILAACGCAVSPRAKAHDACKRSAVRIASRLKVDPADDVWAMGIGFVVHESGYVITCWHTVSPPGPKRAALFGGEAYSARVVCAEKRLDVALLKIESNRTFPVAVLGDSRRLRLGDTVFAKRSPLDKGIVLLQGTVKVLNCGWGYFDFYQSDAIEFDAPIQPGSSGGPLFNVRGEVVGMVTSKNYDIPEHESYATPINTVLKTLAEQLRADGHHDLVTGMTVPPARGLAAVAAVTEGSPAQKAGIEPGDIVTGVDGVPVGRTLDYYIALIGRPAGTVIRLTLRRGNRTIETSLTLGRAPLRPADASRRRSAESTANETSGRGRRRTASWGSARCSTRGATSG